MSPNLKLKRLTSVAAAGVRRWLLVPTVVRLAAAAPRNPLVGWERFWAEVAATGDGGDVLWDTSDPTEMAGYLPILRKYFDPALPVVDVGCGNGRLSRFLAGHFRTVVGVDLSPVAITRAGRDSVGIPNLSYLVMDLTAPDSGRRLLELVGPANVFVRGVFHVLDPADRRRLAENLRPILGAQGRLFLAETNFPGGVFRYLQHLGARPRGIPIPLQRAIRLLPRPDHFGRRERMAGLPAADWTVHLEDAAQITTIPLRDAGRHERIPGYQAVLSVPAATPEMGKKGRQVLEPGRDTVPG